MSPIPDSEQSEGISRPEISDTDPESSPDDSVPTNETDIDLVLEPSTSQPELSEESVPIIEQSSPLESGDTASAVSGEPPSKDINLVETPLEKIEEKPQDKVPPQKLQRGGFLTNTPVPQAPALIDKTNKLKPLNQWLIDAVDMATAEKQRRYLTPLGGRIVSRKRLDGLGLVLSTFRFSEDVDAKKVLEAFKTIFKDSVVEPNQRYRLLGNSNALSKHQVYGQQITGFGSPSTCSQSLTIAMLDSQVNTALPFLSPERIKTVEITRQTKRSKHHGTAVATIMAAEANTFPSLLPNAQLYAINVFALDENGDPETRTDWLLYGLNQLTKFDPMPSVVNLSFGGEASYLLERAFSKLSSQMVFVAAAGNDGTDDLVYPAAYPSVIAVGGVNARLKRSKRSNYGDHVQVVAPGEDIWTSNGEGNGHYASGTSYASPFVAVALAVAMASGASVNDYLASLAGNKLVSIKSHCGG